MDDQKSKSKKRSDTKDDKRLDDAIVFFVDRCFGRGLWTTLRENGYHAEHKDDHFAQNTDDDVWMPEVGQRGWVALTRDTRIRHHPNERLAIVRSGLRMFALTSKKGASGKGINGKEMAEIILSQMDRMMAILRKTPGPFLAAITRTGVTLIPITATK